MHIDYLDYLPDEFKDQALELYLHALRDKLEPIIGLDSRALKVLGSNLAANRCMAAVCDQQLAGIIGTQTEKGGFLNPTLKSMVEVYGLAGGILRMFGLALLHHSTAADEIYVDGIAVRKEMRGRGVGSRLLEMLEETALKQGIRRLTLEVIDTNPRAEALYKRLGYVVRKRRIIWPLNWCIRFPFKAACLMEKKLG